MPKASMDLERAREEILDVSQKGNVVDRLMVLERIVTELLAQLTAAPKSRRADRS